MNDEIIAQIPSMQIQELWNMYDMLYRSGYNIDEKLYMNVKNGFNIEFDIRRFIKFVNGMSTGIKRNYKDETMFIGERKYSTINFDDEIDNRKAVMRQELMNYFQEEDNITESRVKT